HAKHENSAPFGWRAVWPRMCGSGFRGADLEVGDCSHRVHRPDHLGLNVTFRNIAIFRFLAIPKTGKAVARRSAGDFAKCI
ncbi:MAG: hypothetical protein KGI46_02570, partial [Alphaproteobacteria bacterium]|nr:hypothetical protein [Alphaproteobacteria bacterium]